MTGGQWVKIDAHVTSSPLAARLKREFGAAGLMTWVAFLAACKRSHTPGQITFNSPAEALMILGLEDVRLLDNDGGEWDLETFWRVLGQLKQTKRTARGQLVNVRCTHWGEWQKDISRDDERERKAKSRAQNDRDTTGTRAGHERPNVPLEIEKEVEKIPPPPSSNEATGHDPSGSVRRRRENRPANGNGHVTGSDLPSPVGAAVRVLARRRLDNAQADAAAGRRAPIRSTAAWLTAAEKDLTLNADELLGVWAKLGEPDDPDMLADEWDRHSSAVTTAGPDGPSFVERCPTCERLSFDCRCHG